MPTYEQLFKVAQVCHSLSDMGQEILLFLHDEQTIEFFILAGKRAMIEITIYHTQLRLAMNYKSMTRKQLKQHLLNNRNDLEALRELQSRPKQNSVTIPADTSREEAERILREAINRA